MKSSKLTSKYQTTIPKDVRKLLKLKPGDSVSFFVTKDGIVIMRRSQPLDKAYLEALAHTLNEWESKEDAISYEDLQEL